jgi:hypothetical protein
MAGPGGGNESLLRSFARSLKARNRSPKTISSYLEAARLLSEHTHNPTCSRLHPVTLGADKAASTITKPASERAARRSMIEQRAVPQHAVEELKAAVLPAAVVIRRPKG